MVASERDAGWQSASELVWAPELLDVRTSVLLAVDFQTRLLSAMPEPSRPGLRRRLAALLKAAGYLGVPVIATRQYPLGLGPLDPELEAMMPSATLVFDKTAFSCARARGVQEALAATGRHSIVVVGIETHVCVLQTAFELAALGFGVSVVADAVASRSVSDSERALLRLQQADIVLPTTESVVVEWLRDAAHPRFKDILALIK